MDVLQMMQRFVSPPCEDCLYHLGVVRCLVSPCPACLMTGIRPSFCGSCVFGRRSPLEEFQKEMAGVYTKSIGEGTLDEVLMVYKSLADIIDVIRDSVDVIEVLKPLYNFKAGGPRGAVEENEDGKEQEEAGED